MSNVLRKLDNILPTEKTIPSIILMHNSKHGSIQPRLCFSKLYFSKQGLRISRTEYSYLQLHSTQFKDTTSQNKHLCYCTMLKCVTAQLQETVNCPCDIRIMANQGSVKFSLKNKFSFLITLTCT
jgi:hypothetical protein